MPKSPACNVTVERRSIAVTKMQLSAVRVLRLFFSFTIVQLCSWSLPNNSRCLMVVLTKRSDHPLSSRLTHQWNSTPMLRRLTKFDLTSLDPGIVRLWANDHSFLNLKKDPGSSLLECAQVRKRNMDLLKWIFQNAPVPFYWRTGDRRIFPCLWCSILIHFRQQRPSVQEASLAASSASHRSSTMDASILLDGGDLQ